jgi:hypothetical protein
LFFPCLSIPSPQGKELADDEEFGAIRPVEDANVGDYVIVNSSTCEFKYPFWVGKITFMNPKTQKVTKVVRFHFYFLLLFQYSFQLFP